MSLFFARLKYACNRVLEFCRYNLYTKCYVPYKVRRIRQKEQIRVLFVLHELGSWKTETLYQEMLVHSRFVPSLLLVPSVQNEAEFSHFENYLKQQGYNYSTIRSDENVKTTFSPDIIFYQKQYEGFYPQNVAFRANLKSLFCFVRYCFENMLDPVHLNTPLQNYCWQLYFENYLVQADSVNVMTNHAINSMVTGLPFMDDLCKNKAIYSDCWQQQDSLKKRIIYAPHHSIVEGWTNQSTFLQYGDFLLEMAQKYKDQVQWAFKPHPLLEPKLKKIWGEERTRRYFEKWSILANCQIETGKYNALFAYSDAMIHDSGSFILEYLYTQNPVLFIKQRENVIDDFNKQTKMALDVHYQATNKKDIEKFILDVIEGNDPMKDRRGEFYKKYLLPPNGKSACENIINAILGEDEK